MQVIDNAGFRATKNITIPENIHLIQIPPYRPELNSSEKVRQWMKVRVAMKVFESVEELQDKITEIVKELCQQRIKALLIIKI